MDFVHFRSSRRKSGKNPKTEKRHLFNDKPREKFPGTLAADTNLNLIRSQSGAASASVHRTQKLSGLFGQGRGKLDGWERPKPAQPLRPPIRGLCFIPQDPPSFDSPFYFANSHLRRGFNALRKKVHRVYLRNKYLCLRRERHSR